MGSRRIADWLLALCSAVAVASCLLALYAAWSWPLVGDAALMRYVVFLLHAGRAPYRQITDINLPGSYLLEASAMHVFGANAIGLRIYDGLLSLLACAGAVALSAKGWRARLCGMIAGLLFVLIHLRDGVVEGGERDLAMAVLVLLAYVVLLRSPWRNRLAGIMAFEFLVGVTLTIKPTLLPLAALPILVGVLRKESIQTSVKTVGLGVAALVIPTLVMFLWLYDLGSLAAFFHVLRTVDAAHSGLAHQSVTALLTHAASPIPVVFLLALVLAVRLRPLDVESKLLLAGAACGLLSFVAQWKGFPYQRYPFLLLALVLMARLLAKGLDGEGLNLAVAGATVAFIGLWLAPVYAATVRTYDHSAPFEEALSRDLAARHVGSGSVQCLDTVGGCITTLYDLRLIQSTGFLYDCYAYEGSDQARYRTDLLAALNAARPRTIVLSNQFCLEQRYNFDRLRQWPELGEFLARNYRLDGGWQPSSTVRWWHQRERPPGYEVFTLK